MFMKEYAKSTKDVINDLNVDEVKGLTKEQS